ncbi:MAG: DUF2306 domain-containing protein [Pseudomonadota bacterium]
MSLWSKRDHAALLFLGVVTVLTMLVMLKVELPLLMGLSPDWERKIDSYRVILHIHAVLGSVALFSAPLQFVGHFRRSHVRLHRRLGMSYALSVLASAPIGVYIAFAHLSGLEMWAGALQGVMWFGCTALAVRTIFNRQLAQHRLWIMRSYALTLTFVVSRLLIDVLGIRLAASEGGNGTVLCMITLAALALAELLGQPRGASALPA